MNCGEHQLRAIAAAVKRLRASDTPRTRSNALKAFAAAVKQLEADVAQQYPKLRNDGTAIVKRKARGCRCPICRVPMKSFKMLATHLRAVHLITKCFCGLRFRNTTHLARHLAGVGDVRIHFAEAAMQKAAGLL